MNNSDDHNKLDDLYKTRKQQFKAPKSSKFSARKAAPFWKTFSFYSSISAFGLALVVVIPMLNSPIQSDLIIEQSTESPQQFLRHLDDSDLFSAEPMLESATMDSPSIVSPILDNIQIKRASDSVEIKSSVFLEMNKQKKSNPCKQKKLAKTQKTNKTQSIANNTQTNTQIDCP
ncbi:MAG: hypothetical protein HRU38_18160 [Saccharospirillaceae bacterium]|nr:hypothetical protein [Pseudomonadales bacterium]NRB80561.1 hypothetical protein [Saccharospirillaceae bacterium]